MPLLVLFLLFIVVPAVEIALFIEVGGWLGVWPTIVLTFATAAAGTVMLRVQGLSTLRRAEAQLARDEPPVAELIDGLCLLLAGLCLLIPGFATDAIGLLLFVPPLRHAIGRWLWGWLRARRGRGDPRATVIDGDFEEVHEPADESRRLDGSRWGRR